MLPANHDGRDRGAHPSIVRRHARGLTAGAGNGGRRKITLSDGDSPAGASQRSPGATAARTSFRPDSTRTSLNETPLFFDVGAWPCSRIPSMHITWLAPGTFYSCPCTDWAYPSSTALAARLRFQLDVSQYYVIRTIIILNSTSGHGVFEFPGLSKSLSWWLHEHRQS
jgi:hypothetical protein